MSVKIPPSKRSPSAHRRANRRWYAAHSSEILATQRERRLAKKLGKSTALKTKAQIQRRLKYLRRRAKELAYAAEKRDVKTPTVP
jgi:hypothetical protein